MFVRVLGYYEVFEGRDPGDVYVIKVAVVRINAGRNAVSSYYILDI